MSSLKQYTELYDSHRDLIDGRCEAPAMNAARVRARASLTDSSRLPDKGDEGYERTSLEQMFAPDLGVNVNRLQMPLDPSATFRCDVPNLSTLLAFVVNDTFVPTTTLLNNAPEGLTVMSLARACREFPALTDSYYASCAPLDRSAVALNTMMAQDGVLIHVGRGVRVQRPVQIVNIFNSPEPLAAFRRILVVAEEDSEINILLCDHTQRHDADYISSQVIEVVAKERSRVDIYDIEEATPRTRRLNQVFARQHDGSNLLLNGMTLLNGSTRNEYDIDIAGEHCETMLAGMAIASGTQHVDNTSDVHHRAPHSHSNQLFKYALDGHATGAFEGCIEVTADAPYTQAYQSNRNILVSAEARMHTKPQLLIYNDEVKCSHGATTGQLDANALFYMQARGIPQDEARTLLMQAFMVDVIDTIRVEGVRDRLRHMVERRFACGGDQSALCSDCSLHSN